MNEGYAHHAENVTTGTILIVKRNMWILKKKSNIKNLWLVSYKNHSKIRDKKNYFSYYPG